MSLTTAGWYTHPLYGAAKDGDINTLIDLLNNGHKANTCNLSGISILHVACSHGHDTIVSLLLQKGANVNFSVLYDLTPLHVAVLKGYWKCARILLDNGADVNGKSITGWTPLHIARCKQDQIFIDMLEQKGAIKEPNPPFGVLKWEGITISPAYE